MASAEVGAIRVKLTGDGSDLQKALSKARASLESFAKSAKKVSIASGVAFAGMTAAIWKVTQAASVQREAELRLAAAIRGSGAAINIDRIKKYAAQLQSVTTYSDEVSISAAAMLATFQLNEDQIIGMLPRLQNMATMYGMDLSSAAVQVGKALTGSSGALSKYGIVLSDAQKQAYDMANQTERVALLMDILDANTGPAAETMAKTATGAFTQMGNAFGDLLEEFGYLTEGPLAAAFRKLTAVWNEAIVFVQDLSPETKQLAVTIAFTATAVLGLVSAITGFVALTPSILSVASAFSAVLVPVLAIGAAIAGIILYTGAMKEAWEGDLMSIKSTFTAIGTWLVNAWRTVTDAMSRLWTGMVDGIRAGLEKALGWVRDIGKWIQETGITAASWATGETPEMAWRTQREAKKEGLLSTEEIGVFDDIAKKLDSVAFNVSEFSNNVGATIVDAWENLGSDLKNAFTKGVGGEFIASKLSDFSSLVKKFVAEQVPAAGAAGAAVSAKKGTAEAFDEDAFLSDIGESLAEQLARRKAEVGAEHRAALKQQAIGYGQESMGSAGELVSAAKQGGETAGVWGAIIAVVYKLLSMTQFFQKVVDHFNVIVNTMVMALDGMLKPLAPLIDIASSALIVLANFTSALSQIFFATGALSTAFEWVAEQLTNAVDWIVKWWNKLITGLAKLLGKIPIVGDKLESMARKLILENTEQAKATYDAVFGDAPAIETDMEKASDAVATFSESLTNVPEGFKVALARFNATSPEPGPLDAGALGDTTAAASSSTVINNEVTINGVNDPVRIYEEIKKLQEIDQFITTGTTISTGGPNVVTRLK